MDVEPTMQFILDQQAEFTAGMVKVREALKLLATQQVKTDRQLQATANLVRAGMKLVMIHDRQIQENGRQIERLARLQEKTDKKLDRLIEVLLRQNTNGKRS